MEISIRSTVNKDGTTIEVGVQKVLTDNMLKNLGDDGLINVFKNMLRKLESDKKTVLNNS